MFDFSLSLTIEVKSCEKMQFLLKDTCEIFCCGKHPNEGCGAQIARLGHALDYSSNRKNIILFILEKKM